MSKEDNLILNRTDSQNQSNNVLTLEQIIFEKEYQQNLLLQINYLFQETQNQQTQMSNEMNLLFKEIKQNEQQLEKLKKDVEKISVHILPKLMTAQESLDALDLKSCVSPPESYAPLHDNFCKLLSILLEIMGEKKQQLTNKQTAIEFSKINRVQTFYTTNFDNFTDSQIEEFILKLKDPEISPDKLWKINRASYHLRIWLQNKLEVQQLLRSSLEVQKFKQIQEQLSIKQNEINNIQVKFQEVQEKSNTYNNHIKQIQEMINTYNQLIKIYNEQNKSNSERINL